MIERVAAALEGRGFLRRGRRVGVAVSGGADSVFLLCALREIGVASAALHVNHMLRGAESDADETFVADLAARFGVPFFGQRAAVPEGNTEQEARRQRYAFFAEQIAIGVCDVVATGHTLDDQAETVLYRFLRGAGTAGLAGIRPMTDVGIIRPLLGLRREAIRDWLREHGIAWREDASNLDPAFDRNRLRNELIPQLDPALPDILATTAEWARGEEDYWSAELDRLEPLHLKSDGETVLIRTGPFVELHEAVQRRLLRRAIEKVRGSLRSIDFRHVEAIRSLVDSELGSGRLQLPGTDIFRSFDWLRIAPLGHDSKLERNWEIGVEPPGIHAVPERKVAIATELTPVQRVYNNEMDAVDAEVSAGVLVLRNWRPGDQLQRPGNAESVKLKMLFQEHRVPLWERRNWPVLVRGEEIVWTRRFGVAAQFAPGAKTAKLLRIREERV